MEEHTSAGRGSDRVWAARIVADGDEEAFNALYDAHTPALFAFVLRLLGGAEVEAEDVVQDVWLRAITALPGFRWESGFRSWLLGIGLNRCRELIRRRERRSGLTRWIPFRKAFELEPWRGLDIERAIERLPEHSRMVLVLHDVEGLAHDEIGERLGIAVGTSRSRLFHARRAMKAFLGDEDEEETA